MAAKFIKKTKKNTKPSDRLKKRKRKLFWVLILGLLATFFVLVGISFQVSKLPEVPQGTPLKDNPIYIAERNVDYTNLNWADKADNEGFSNYNGPNATFIWRADIYVAKKSSLYRIRGEVKPKIVFQIRDLEGQISIPSSVEFDQMNQFPLQGEFRRVDGDQLKDLTLYVKSGAGISFLGIDMISPNARSTIRINGVGFNTATLHLPPGSHLVKYGDALHPAGIYQADDHTFLMHNFATPAIVYYNPGFHALVQTAFGALALAFLFLSLFMHRLPLPHWRLRANHMIIVLIVLAVSMFYLAGLFPNPQNIVLNFDNREIEYDPIDNVRLTSDKEVSNYLWLVLGMTRSIDSMVVGKLDACGERAPFRDRYYYLTKLSAKKIFILDNYKDSTCGQYIQELAPEKTEIISQADVSAELADLPGRHYSGGNTLFRNNARLIVILGFMVFFVSVGFLILKAIEVKNPRQIPRLIIWGFLIFFGLMAVYLFVGYTAHLPVAYHGSTRTGLVMINYLTPGGIISGGNLISALFAGLGGLVAFFLVWRYRNRIRLQVIPLLIMAFIIALILPGMEYQTKRSVLSSVGAEAYVWDYKLQDEFYLINFYKNIQSGNLAEFFNSIYTYNIQRDINYGDSLVMEQRYTEAGQVFKAIIDNSREIKSEDYLYYLGKANYKLAILLIQRGEDLDTSGYNSSRFYLEESIAYFEEYLRITDETFLVPETYFNVAESYRELDQFETAITYYRKILNEFPHNRHVSFAKYSLGVCYQEMEDYNQARKEYTEFLQEFPTSKYASHVALNYANTFFEEKNYPQAILEFRRFKANYYSDKLAAYAQINIGNCYFSTKNYPKSIAEYEVFLEENPEHRMTASVLYNIARNYSRMGDETNAVSIWRGIMRDFPGTKTAIEARLGLGIFYMEIGRIEDSQVILRSVADDLLVPDRYRRRAYELLYEQYNDSNDIPAAVEAQQMANELTPEEPETTSRYLALASEPQTMGAATISPIAQDLSKPNKKVFQYSKASLFDKIFMASDNFNAQLEEAADGIYNSLMSLFLPTREEEQIAETSEADQRSLFEVNKPSRGMIMFFAGLILIMIAPLLTNRVVRTLILLLAAFLIGRGVIRIAEQDPFKAMYSIWPGLKLGIVIATFFIIMNYIVWSLWFVGKKGYFYLGGSRHLKKQMEKARDRLTR